MEGVSFEYWSPAPFWKANGRYVGVGAGGNPKENVLRCFGADFANDPIYKGDVNRFLEDFKEAKADPDLRILAFKKPNGKLTVVLANRSFTEHTFCSLPLRF